LYSWIVVICTGINSFGTFNDFKYLPVKMLVSQIFMKMIGDSYIQMSIVFYDAPSFK